MKLDHLLVRLATPLWRVVAFGIGIGALAGGLALTGVSLNEASAIIRIHQPSEVPFNTATTEDLTSYISGEIAYLSSAGFTTAVERRAGNDETPKVTAVQVGESSTVVLTAAAPDSEKAVNTLNTAVTVYNEHLEEQTRGRGESALQVIDELLRAQPPLDATADSASLRESRDAIAVQIASLNDVQIVQPALMEPPSGAPRSILGAVAGGFLGGLIILGVALVWRNRSGIITSSETLDRLVDEGIVGNLTGPIDCEDLSGRRVARQQVARLLYAQLPAPRAGTVLVVGASDDSGSATVADLIKSAVEEVDLTNSVPEEIIAAGISIEDKSGNTATIVVDGGTISASPSLPNRAANADHLVIVARIGRDTLGSVSALCCIGPEHSQPTVVLTR